jgi:hypothetical protein
MYHDVSICGANERECAELPASGIGCGIRATRLRGQMKERACGRGDRSR